MNVTVRYFASLRELLGEREAVEGLDEGMTSGLLRALLASRSDAHRAALGEGRAVRCAVNQTMVNDDEPLTNGAEVAFFPPVTGG